MGSDAPSLAAQLPLLDGAEGKFDVTFAKNKIRALLPNLPGMAVVDSSGVHAKTLDAPPVASTCELGGGSRLPVLIGIRAVSHVSALVASHEISAFMPRHLLECATPPRVVATSTTMNLGDYAARLNWLLPGGSSCLGWRPPAHV